MGNYLEAKIRHFFPFWAIKEWAGRDIGRSELQCVCVSACCLQELPQSLRCNSFVTFITVVNSPHQQLPAMHFSRHLLTFSFHTNNKETFTILMPMMSAPPPPQKPFYNAHQCLSMKKKKKKIFATLFKSAINSWIGYWKQYVAGVEKLRGVSDWFWNNHYC